MKLWLDDVRLPPNNDWTWVKTVKDAKALLELGMITEASLDHDLGCDIFGRNNQTGYDLCKWMAETDNWPTQSIRVHSMNPVGRMNMQAIIDRYFEGT